MKKIFTLVMMAMTLFAMEANAQSLRKTWDFRTGFSQQTINALKGDQEEFGDSKYWRNYESDATKADEQHYWNASRDARNSDLYACTHNGGMEKVIPELEGLKLGMSNAKKFVITYNGATAPNEFESEGGPAIGEPIPHGNSYVWLNGKNETITFQAAVNQTIKIGVESHAVNRTKLGEARGISLTTSTGSLELKSGNPVPTYYTECEWELTGDDGAVADVQLKTTNGCHIYYIIVGEGDDVNANKTKVAYITDGEGSSETAYQILAADETLNVTVLDVNSLQAFTPDQLADYDATVISPIVSAESPVVATLKQAVAFYPIINLNAGLYAAWGYGEAIPTDMPIAVISDLKHFLVNGFVEGQDYEITDDLNVISFGDEPITVVRLGSFFEGDDMPVVDGIDDTLAAVHVHNPYHNAYIYMPIGTTDGAKKLLTNALDLAKGSKSEIVQTPAPKIALEYKNQNTNITLSMASSTLPKSHIYYTIDGSTPTEQSQEYTDVINVWNPCIVKAVAIAEGYLLSEVAEAQVEIFSQPETPAISCEYEDGKTLVSLNCATPNVDLWYSFNYAEAADTTKSMKYTGEPFAVALPTDFTAFSVAGQQVFSELAQQRIVVKNAKVRQDQIGLFDANAADWQKGGSGSTIYFFSWGKNATSIYDETQEGITTEDPETGDEITVYPEKEYEYYIPENAENYWEVKSKGQVMIWQNLSVGSDPGNDAGYNPETTGDIISYAKATNHDIQFGGKASGEPCTGAIQSLKKFQGPFDVVTIVGTAAGGDNMGRMQVEVSKDSLEWTKIGDEMLTSKVKRLWKTYTRSYDEADEVYVRIIQAGGGSSVQIYNIYILNEGENSLVLKQQYDEEFAQSGQGITNVTAPKAATGIYNLNGIRLNQLQRGLNIVVGNDGKVQKVLK